MTCPWCRSHGLQMFLGTLGNLDHWRCRYCGADWSRPADQDPYIAVNDQQTEEE